MTTGIDTGGKSGDRTAIVLTVQRDAVVTINGKDLCVIDSIDSGSYMAIIEGLFDRDDIRAAFVAEAIERGEASPPVWAIAVRRNDDQSSFTAQMHSTQFEAEHEAEKMNEIVNHATYLVRHWKGNDTP